MDKKTMTRMIVGFMPARALGVAAQLHIVDELVDAALTVDELATRVGADPAALHRLLRALEGLDVVAQTNGLWQIGPAGPLLQDVPGSLRGLAATQAGEMFRAWADLDQAIKTGASVFDTIFGAPYFQYAAHRPELSAAFDHGMEAISSLSAIPLLRKDWTDVRRVVDVAGGTGLLLRLLLQEKPHLHGVLFDQAHVVQAATTLFAHADLQNRTSIVAGDMFESIPEGSDVYVLSSVLHDWDDDAALRILRRVREAMGNDSELVVLELVVVEDGGDHLANWMDLHMLTVLGGRERTAQQWHDLLAAADLTITDVFRGPRSTAMTARPMPCRTTEANVAPEESPRRAMR